MLFPSLKFNKRSVVFIFVLIVIFTFLIGIRLGRRIKEADINVEMRKKPMNAAPTPPSITFTLKKYIASACGFQFLYPSFLEELNESTDEAKLLYHTYIITILCDSTSAKMKKFLLQKKQLLSTEIQTAHSVAITLYPSDIINTSYVYFIHPQSKKQILMHVSSDLLDLFKNTIQFL